MNLFFGKIMMQLLLASPNTNKFTPTHVANVVMSYELSVAVNKLLSNRVPYNSEHVLYHCSCVSGVQKSLSWPSWQRLSSEVSFRPRACCGELETWLSFESDLEAPVRGCWQVRSSWAAGRGPSLLAGLQQCICVILALGRLRPAGDAANSKPTWITQQDFVKRKQTFQPSVKGWISHQGELQGPFQRLLTKSSFVVVVIIIQIFSVTLYPINMLS